MLLTRSSMEYYLMFTERFFKPKVTNQQNRTDLKYHGEPFRGHLAHFQSFIYSIPRVTNAKIKRFVLIHVSQIIAENNRYLDKEVCMVYSVTCMAYLVTCIWTFSHGQWLVFIVNSR